MFLSVVIPTQHRNDLLALCLDRLAPDVQTLGKAFYEVIVTDDGTETAAQDMIAARYPWARWVAGPRNGPAANRNNGARIATGEYIAFTDDDCIPSVDWLMAFHRAVANGIDLYEGKTTCDAGLRSPLDFAPIHLTGGWLWPCNMMVSKDLFLSLGGFDEAYPLAHMEDTNFRERAALMRVTPRWVPDAVVDHPPRRAAMFRAIASQHECEVIHTFKSGKRPRLLTILCGTARARFHTLRCYRVSLDSITFSASTVLELFWCMLSFRGWVYKCRNARHPSRSGAELKC